MSKFNNIALAVITTLILICPIAYRVAAELPGPVKVPEKSWLEQRKLMTVGDLRECSFVDSSLQDNLEQFTSDSVLARDIIMIGAATLQRAGIQTAAFPFGFTLYHTYYGSEYVADSADELILPVPAQIPTSNSTLKYLDAWIDTINGAAREHPDINFVVCQVTEGSQTQANPAYALTRNSELINADYIEQSIISRFDESIHAFCDPIESVEEMRDEWFTCDVHWTLERATKSYNAIAEELGLQPFEYNPDTAIELVSEWYGTSARGSRDFDYPSTLSDMPDDYSNLTFYRLDDSAEKGKRFALGKRELILSGEKTSKILSRTGGYGQYYGGKQALIENSGENNGKTCLLVGDSFTHCLKRVIADNYEKTIAILPGNNLVNRSLESLIDKYDVDDVIVLTQSMKFNQVGKTSPAFIGVK